jgi:hypothetical protein
MWIVTDYMVQVLLFSYFANVSYVQKTLEKVGIINKAYGISGTPSKNTSGA